jgi:hypothetical protein
MRRYAVRELPLRHCANDQEYDFDYDDDEDDTMDDGEGDVENQYYKAKCESPHLLENEIKQRRQTWILAASETSC